MKVRICGQLRICIYYFGGIMGIYYGIVTLSVIMFAVQFFFSDRYEKECGSGADATFVYSLLSALAGIICLLFVCKFKVEATLFTILCASAAAVNMILFSFCSLKALGKINLSLYSLFSMLGGMMLPFILGIVFYNEGITVAKIVCVILVTLALILTVKKGEGKNGFIYYAGILVLNGMSGVISKFFDSAKFEKTSAASYSLWIAILTVVFSAIVLCFMRKKVKKPTFKAVTFSFGGGALNQIANFLLLIALAVLPASVQYPFITGGVIITSTVISIIMGQKPTKKEIFAIVLSFAGVLALVII